MAVTLKCRKCGVTLKVKDELAGRSVKCPRCNEIQVVPSRAEETRADAVERAPCPACAELIMPGAKKCRFCGHLIGSVAAPAPGGGTVPSALSHGEKAVNIPAILSLPLALISGLVMGLLFIVIFHFSHLVQSLAAGAAVALGAVACGVAGNHPCLAQDEENGRAGNGHFRHDTRVSGSVQLRRQLFYGQGRIGDVAS